MKHRTAVLRSLCLAGAVSNECRRARTRQGRAVEFLSPPSAAAWARAVSWRSARSRPRSASWRDPGWPRASERLVAAQTLLAEHHGFTPRPDRDLVPAAKPQPERRRAPRPFEAVRAYPRYVQETRPVADRPPSRMALVEKPAAPGADRPHLARGVSQRDPALGPARFADPRAQQRIPAGADPSGNPGIGVAVFAAHPDAVLPVIFVNRVPGSVAARFDAVDENLPDRPRFVARDIEQGVVERRGELGQGAVETVHFLSRPERAQHQHRSRVFRRRLFERGLPARVPGPVTAGSLQHIPRLAEARACGPQRAASRSPV